MKPMSTFKRLHRFSVFSFLVSAVVCCTLLNLSAASVISPLSTWLENENQVTQLAVNGSLTELLRASRSPGDELILGPPSEDSDLEICGRSKEGTKPCSRVVCEEWLSLEQENTHVGGGRCICECCNGQEATCEVTFNPVGTFLGCGCIGSISEEEEEVSSTTNDGDSGNTVNLTNSGTETEQNETVPDCVETAWLKQHGFSHGILRERGSSSVLCLSGLPCATPGHLLRQCDADGISCQLRTYEEMCKQRDDCVYRCSEVSRLTNSVDWSMVRSTASNGSSISLTSLSVHPHGGLFWLSYGVAYVADWLNSLGLGVLCDFVVLSALGIGELRHDIQDLFHRIRIEFFARSI